jgi:hypothetical protein
MPSFVTGIHDVLQKTLLCFEDKSSDEGYIEHMSQIWNITWNKKKATPPPYLSISDAIRSIAQGKGYLEAVGSEMEIHICSDERDEDDDVQELKSSDASLRSRSLVTRPLLNREKVDRKRSRSSGGGIAKRRNLKKFKNKRSEVTEEKKFEDVGEEDKEGEEDAGETERVLTATGAKCIDNGDNDSGGEVTRKNGKQNGQKVEMLGEGRRESVNVKQKDNGEGNMVVSTNGFLKDTGESNTNVPTNRSLKPDTPDNTHENTQEPMDVSSTEGANMNLPIDTNLTPYKDYENIMEPMDISDLEGDNMAQPCSVTSINAKVSLPSI